MVASPRLVVAEASPSERCGCVRACTFFEPLRGRPDVAAVLARAAAQAAAFPAAVADA